MSCPSYLMRIYSHEDQFLIGHSSMEASPSESIMNPVYIPPVMFHLPQLIPEVQPTNQHLIKYLSVHTCLVQCCSTDYRYADGRYRRRSCEDSMKILYNAGVVFYRLTTIMHLIFICIHSCVCTDYTIVYLGQFWYICHAAPVPGCPCVLFRGYITN